MKQKKTPIYLLTGAVVLAAIVGGINLLQSGAIKPGAPPPVDAPRAGDASGHVAGDVANKMTAGSDKVDDGHDLHAPKQPGDPLEGSLLKPMPKSAFRPKPNDALTSTQWYDDPKKNPRKG